MKPDIWYTDGDAALVSLVETAISELESLCAVECRDEKNLRAGCFEQYSHTKFALKMLLQEIRAHSDISPRIVTNEFAKKMDDYSCENLEISYVFSVAHDTAQGVLDETTF